MNRTIRSRSLATLLVAGLLMAACTQQPVEETTTESSVESTVEETVSAFAPIEITEDYSGSILGVENWHIETEDLSYGSIDYTNVFLINDDTGIAFVAYGGVTDEIGAYITDLNGDGEIEVVCNTNMGAESDMHSYTCVFRSNNGNIEIAYPCYGDLNDNPMGENYPSIAEEFGLDITASNYSDYSDRYEPATNEIMLTNRADGTEYEITYEYLQFTSFMSDVEAEEGTGPSDDIDIEYETAEPIVTDISDTEKEVTFYRDGMEIEGKLYLPEGEGPFPVIVMSCGLMQPYTDYEAEAQAFAANGYATVAFSFIDYSNPYGLAPDPTEMGTVFLSEMRDLYAVMDSLSCLPGIDSENVYLWGHSFGGLTAAYAGCDRGSEVNGLILVEPALVIGEELPVEYEDGSSATLRIYDLLGSCELDTVIYMGTHDGYGMDPTSFDAVLAIMPSAELVIIDGADHYFEDEYGLQMVEDASDKITGWNS